MAHKEAGSMKKIPNSVQNVFSFTKARGPVSIQQIAQGLGVDCKKVYLAVKRCEELGLISSQKVKANNRSIKVMSVRPELDALSIESVYLESGSRLLKQKESRRKVCCRWHTA